jgi:ribonucleoside-diphosphate reductase alpha chain
MILAMEIIVGNSSRTRARRDRRELHLFRPAGSGLRQPRRAAHGVAACPTTDDQGRDYAAAITALMCGQAYLTVAEIASHHRSAFDDYSENREPLLEVIRKHRAAVNEHQRQSGAPEHLLERGSRTVWREAYALGHDYGYRNAQVTVLAPTGTIGFMMDCDTTGVEPDIALVKYKKLVDGGIMKIVNQTVPARAGEAGLRPRNRDRGDPRVHQGAGDDRGRAAT